jgi:hypothetical protein
MIYFNQDSYLVTGVVELWTELETFRHETKNDLHVTFGNGLLSFSSD